MPKTQKPDLMERTRAAVFYANSTRVGEAERAFAFLSLFHPEMSDARRLDLAREIAKEK